MVKVYTVSRKNSIMIVCDLAESAAFAFAVDAVLVLGGSYERILGRHIAVFVPLGPGRVVAR